jgi:hypothetical protein
MKRDMTMEERKQACAMIREGLTFWGVASAFPECRAHDLRTVWRMVRGAPKQNWLPSPEEMKELKEEVQEKWQPEEWSKRWVGRWASAREEDLQSAASRLMPY